MLRNRLIYLAALIAATVFYCFFYAWFSWFLLLLLLSLPAFSLAVSLPAMTTMQLHIMAQEKVRRGDAAQIRLQTVCRLPQPRCRFTIRVTEVLTGCQTRCRVWPRALQMTLDLPTEHCGEIVCAVEKVWVYDYLGLFRLPRRWRSQGNSLVLPSPRPPQNLPNLAQLQILSYRPKPGGGFAEVHELRGYRPGDSMREVHWKLTAKADQLIVREPQVPDQGPVVLTLDLTGDPRELDSCLDQTCWLSQWLLEHEVVHVVRWLGCDGSRQCSVQRPEDLETLAEQLCRSGPAPAGTTAKDWAGDACWHYHVLPREEETI